MKRQSFFEKGSIFRRIFIPVMSVLLVQALLYIGFFQFSGLLEQSTTDSFDTLNERVDTRKTYLENEMNQRWSNLREVETMILAQIAEGLEENGATIGDIQTDAVLNEKLIQKVSSNILYLLRKKLCLRCVYCPQRSWHPQHRARRILRRALHA